MVSGSCSVVLLKSGTQGRFLASMEVAVEAFFAGRAGLVGGAAVTTTTQPMAHRTLLSNTTVDLEVVRMVRWERGTRVRNVAVSLRQLFLRGATWNPGTNFRREPRH